MLALLKTAPPYVISVTERRNREENDFKDFFVNIANLIYKYIK